MHATTGLLRLAGLALLASLLGGCMVHSTMPLIPDSAMPEGLDGNYQVMGAMDARTMRKMPRAERAQCLDPGYTGQPAEMADQPRRKSVHLYYCGYDTEKKEPLPTTRIRRGEKGFLVQDQEDRPEALRLKPLHADLYLSQLENNTGGTRFDYLLLRTRAGNIEFIPMFCQDFPSAPVKAIELPAPLSQFPAPPSDGSVKPEPKPGSADSAKDCEITSIESIQGDLDAFVARVDAGTAPPLVILRRIPQ